MLKRDLILRIIEELKRLVARVATLREQGDPDAAQAEVDAAAGSLAGMDLTLAAGLGSAALARLVAEPVKLGAVAKLMLLRSDLAADRADEAGSTTWYGRAVELYLEAAAAGGTLDAEAREAVDAWPDEALSARGRELKGKLAKA